VGEFVQAPLPDSSPLLFPQGVLRGSRDTRSPPTLQATCPGGVQEFGDGPPGTGVALSIRICAEAPQQLHPGPCRLVFCDQPQKPVLVTDGQLRDMPDQRACIAGHRGERRAGLGRDLQKVRVEAEKVGQGALRSSE
jgi:hypothetical protein